MVDYGCFEQECNKRGRSEVKKIAGSWQMEGAWKCFKIRGLFTDRLS